jgi:hypothetical protein
VTIRAVRLPLGLLVDVIWGYAAAAVVVAALAHGQNAGPSMIAVAFVVVGSFTLARALREQELGDAQFRAVGATVSVVALFAIVHTEYAAGTPPWNFAWVRAMVMNPGGGHSYIITATLALTALWMRGIVRGRETIGSTSVLHSVAFGLVPVALAAGFAPDVHGPDVFGALAIAYLALALGALALYQAPDPDRPIRSHLAQWGVGATLMLAAAAGLAVIAAAIDPSALGVLAPIGTPLVYVVGHAAAFILGPPLALIGWLFSFIPLPGHHQPQNPVLQATPQLKPDNQHKPLWTRIVGWIIAGGVFSLIALGTIVVLWMLFRRFAKSKEDTGERREHVDDDSSLADDLGAAFEALARRFRRGAKGAASTVEVRRLYHEMLERSAEAGLKRPDAATPLQFAPSLDAHYGSEVPSAISQAFVASRYGAYEFDDRAVRDLRASWRTLDARRPPLS